MINQFIRTFDTRFNTILYNVIFHNRIREWCSHTREYRRTTDTACKCVRIIYGRFAETDIFAHIIFNNVCIFARNSRSPIINRPPNTVVNRIISYNIIVNIADKTYRLTAAVLESTIFNKHIFSRTLCITDYSYTVTAVWTVRNLIAAICELTVQNRDITAISEHNSVVFKIGKRTVVENNIIAIFKLYHRKIFKIYIFDI